MAATLPTVDGVPVIMPPPPGYVVDFENPQRNSVTEAYCLFAVGNFLCLLFIMQRVYVRAVVQRRVQLEDGTLSSFSLAFPPPLLPCLPPPSHPKPVVVQDMSSENIPKKKADPSSTHKHTACLAVAYVSPPRLPRHLSRPSTCRIVKFPF